MSFRTSSCAKRRFEAVEKRSAVGDGGEIRMGHGPDTAKVRCAAPQPVAAASAAVAIAKPNAYLTSALYGAGCGIRHLGSRRLRKEPLESPAAAFALVAETVVQARGAVLPELPRFWSEQVSTPRRRS